MEITLKKIKYSAFASHETHCFEATVYVDGKRAFGVENDGHGGLNSYFPLHTKQTGTAIHDWVSRIDGDLGQQIIRHQDFEIKNSLEIEICERMNEWLRRQEAMRILRRVAYLRNGEIYHLATKVKPTPETLARVKQASWWRKDDLLLNELPKEEAIARICEVLG